MNSASASQNKEIAIKNNTFGIKMVTQPSQSDNVTTLDLVVDKTNNDSETTETEQPNNNQSLTILQIISLTFFLLLFIPFGVFYPFLLLYQKLLNVEWEEQIQLLENDNSPFYKPLTTENYNFKKQKANSQVVISKLQIACSAADNLRQKLTQINSNNDLQSEQAIFAELMSENLAVLIEQEHWTHFNYNTLSLALEEIAIEFDVISCAEKNKFLNQELSLINHGKSTSTNKNFSTKINNSYLVLTLVICTSTPLPLLEEIYTKEQLTQSLIKLSKLEKDNLIKFELLWNPQEEDEYISNEQLLLEYGDLIRLL
ncbi:MAG: DUF1517 domain-containing protein [Waterburya sp.]